LRYGSKDNSKEIVTKWCTDNKVNFKIVDYKGYKFNKDDKRKRKNWGDIPQYEWDFGDARQIALVNTDTDWMFWMDADDVMVNPENIKPLLEEVKIASVVMANLPYHYAQDAQGNDVIYQYRERLLKIRYDGELRAEWHDPVHEYCLIPQELFTNPPL
jgi:glycosyltransferase involved in cell wall biosynthesis